MSSEPDIYFWLDDFGLDLIVEMHGLDLTVEIHG